jgi:hypothetical protein
MTPEESQMLSALVDRIKAAPAQDHDAEAEKVIAGLVAARPDTTYLLTQTVLMQDFALRNAQAQIAELQRQVQANQAPKPSGSFLGGLFASRPAPSSVPPTGPWVQTPQPMAPQPTAYAQPGYAPVTMQPAQTSGFLRQAATTAAGIAGGALLFEGISSLFSGHQGYGGFMGGGGMMGGGGGPWGGGDFSRESISETTIVNNNYYDEPAGGSTGPADYTPDPGFDQSDSGFQDTSSSDFSGGGGGSDDYV